MSDFPFEPGEGMTPEKWEQLRSLSAEAGAEQVRSLSAELEEAFAGDLLIDAGTLFVALCAVQFGIMGVDIAQAVREDDEQRRRLVRGAELARGGVIPTTPEPEQPTDSAGFYRRALVDVARLLPPAEPGEDTPIGRAHDRIHRALYPERHVRGDG